MATERVLRTARATKTDETGIIWVDANIKPDDPSTKHAMESLKKIIPNLTTFTKIEEFSSYIVNVRSGRIFVVSSGGMGKDVSRSAAGNDNVEAIYIFCGNPALHQGWASNCTKIKGIENRIQPICDLIKTCISSSSGGASSSSTSGKSARISQLDSSFLIVVCLKYFIMKIRHEAQDIEYFANNCEKLFKDNPDELELVKEFRKDYRADKAVWWYTRESFIYRTLNSALRRLEVDVILNMAFFIKDLQQKIEQLYKAQLSSYQGKSLKFYRGQGLSNPELRHIMKNNGGAISFNNFLSVSRKRDISYVFASQAAKKADAVGALFIMTIDTDISACPFADIKDHEYLGGEESLLFGMNSIFRIGTVKNDEDNNRIFEIELTLIPINAEEMNAQIQRLDSKLVDDVSWKALVEYFVEQEKFEFVEKMCLTIVKRSIPDREKSYYYNCLGMVQEKSKEYSEALKSYEKALSIDENSLSPKDPQLAISRYNIGMLYYDLKDTSNALQSLRKALEIWQKVYSASHPQIIAVNRMIRKIGAS